MKRCHFYKDSVHFLKNIFGHYLLTNFPSRQPSSTVDAGSTYPQGNSKIKQQTLAHMTALASVI